MEAVERHLRSQQRSFVPLWSPALPSVCVCGGDGGGGARRRQPEAFAFVSPDTLKLQREPEKRWALETGGHLPWQQVLGFSHFVHFSTFLFDKTSCTEDPGFLSLRVAAFPGVLLFL